MQRRRLIGGLLLTLGLALLSAGVSATLGLVHDETRVPVAASAPGATSPSDTTPRLRVHVDAGDASLDPEVPLPVEALPELGTTGLALPFGVAADVGLSSPAATRGGAGSAPGATVATASQQVLVPPMPETVAVGAALFAGTGLVVYFWTSVKAWLFRALVLPLVPLYAKITRAEVFDNGVREKVFEAIRATPGVSASDLARAAGVSWGTIIYHLEVLEQNHMVSSLRKGRHRRYFENGAQLGAAKEVVALLANPVTQSVSEKVKATPGLTQKDLAQATGMSPQALHWHLARLEGAGLVKKVRYGRVVRHFAA